MQQVQLELLDLQAGLDLQDLQGGLDPVLLDQLAQQDLQAIPVLQAGLDPVLLDLLDTLVQRELLDRPDGQVLLVGQDRVLLAQRELLDRLDILVQRDGLDQV